MPIDAVYGDTSSGKTTGLEQLAHHIFQTSGKKTRVYIGDGGGESFNRRGLVDDGVIEMFDYSSLDWPMTVVKMMSELWFPKEPKDPKSKLAAPKANLFDTHGLVIYEGGSVMGQYLADDVQGGMAWQAAQGTGFGGVKDEDDALTVTDKTDSEYAKFNTHGAIAPKHHYIIQKKLLAAIRKSKQFPGMVIWSAHPTESADKTEGGKMGEYGKIIGKAIIGPDFGGKAMASLIGKEFGNLLHFDVIVKDGKPDKDETTAKQIKKLEREYRLYTRRHFDAMQDVLGVQYIAGNRAAIPSEMPDYFVSNEPGDSLLQFYQKMSELRTKARGAKQQ